MKKCECCGSREFKVHNARQICSYCRTDHGGTGDGHSGDMLRWLANSAALRAERYVSWGLMAPNEGRMLVL